MAYECVDGGADLTPRQQMVAGPQRAPYGSGSHQTTIGESTAQTEIYRTPLYDHKLLSDITRLEYSTFAVAQPGTSAPMRQLPYLRVNVDNDGTDDVDQRDASLFFFPSNNADQGAVANGKWQHWNVAEGKINVDGDDGPANATTLQAYAATNPRATLFNNDIGKPTGGAIATIAGCSLGGNDDSFRNGVYHTDRVIVGEAGKDTLFDFEPSIREIKAGIDTKVVNPEHPRGWVKSAFNGATNEDFVSNQDFVRGPAEPPLGDGSLRFRILRADSQRVEQFRTPATTTACCVT
ncbi:MAG: hypothetical protein WKF76_01345 [Nocardioidaceae bacterium]